MQTRYLIVLTGGVFEGASVTTDTGLPVPLTIEELAAACPAINAAAIAEVEHLKVEHEEHVAELLTEHAAVIETVNAEHAEVIETLKAEHAAEIERIRAELTPQSPSILATLDEAFETLVPAELQTQFEPAWVTVRNLLQAGKTGRAAAFVRALPVPEELEPVREQIAATIDGGA